MARVHTPARNAYSTENCTAPRPFCAEVYILQKRDCPVAKSTTAVITSISMFSRFPFVFSIHDTILSPGKSILI